VAFGPGVSVELPGGSYNLKAHYAGDTAFAPAGSNTIALTVNPEPTTTVAAGNALAPVPYGTPVTIGALTTGVNSGLGFPVPGVYTFTDGATTVGTASLAHTGEKFAVVTVGTSANLTLNGNSTLGVGTHSISVASPPASASFLASATTTPVSVTVVKSPPLVSLTPDRTTPALNSSVNLLVSVNNLTGQLYNSYAPVPVSGTATVWDYGTNPATNLGTVTLASTPDAEGAYDGTLKFSFSTAGLHPIIAVYNGDANDYGNISGAANVTVGAAGAKSSTSTTIAPGAGLVAGTYALAGSNISITATVTGDSNGTAPTGTVTFIDTFNKNATVGTATVGAGGVATLTTKTLAAGTHFIIASYAGDANFAASASQSFEVVIGDFTVSMGSAASSTVTAGQSTTALTITYSGTANFMLYPGGASLGSVWLSCSGLPSGAACNFSSATITPTAGSNGTTTGTATVTIGTTAPVLQKAMNNAPRKPSSNGWGGAGGMTLAGLLALGLPFAFRRKKYFGALLGLVLLAVVGTLNGCSTNGPQRYSIESGTGTPAGTSTVTVTATLNGGTLYGTVSRTTTISLTVNAEGQ